MFQSIFYFRISFCAVDWTSKNRQHETNTKKYVATSICVDSEMRCEYY